MKKLTYDELARRLEKIAIENEEARARLTDAHVVIPENKSKEK